MDKPGGFVGYDALTAQKDAGPIIRRIVQEQLADPAHPPLLLHHEPILRDGQILGSIMSGAYGHRLGASLGLGDVSHLGEVGKDWLESGKWEVEVAVQIGAWYDPKGK